MSIIYKGVLNGGADMDVNGNVTAKRTLVYLATSAESSVKILQQTEVPKMGTVHPDNETLCLTNISVSDPMEGDPKTTKYQVTLTYARTRENVENKNNQNTAPWNLPPYDMSYSPVEYVTAFQRGYKDGDTNGNPTDDVLNSAGDPFEESTTQQNLILKFTYNLQNFTPTWISEYLDTINREDVTIVDVSIPAYYGRIRSLVASRQKQYDEKGKVKYNYWIISTEVEIAKKPWYKWIMQRGLFFIDGDTKERIYKRTDGKAGDNFGTKDDCETISTKGTAIPCDEPQRLTADGSLLDPTGTATVDSVYIDFWDKFDCAWTPLNLPKTAQKTSSLTVLSGGTGNA